MVPVTMFCLGMASGCCGSIRTVEATYQMYSSGFDKNVVSGGGKYGEWGMARIAYTSYPELIAIPDIDYARGMRDFMERLNLEDVTECAMGRKDRAMVVLRKVGGGSFDRWSSAELQAMRNAGVRVGPIAHMDKSGVFVFSDRVVVKFKDTAGLQDRDAFLARYGLQGQTVEGGIKGTYSLRFDAAIGEGINNIVDEMMASGIIQYAYPTIWAPADRPSDR